MYICLFIHNRLSARDLREGGPEQVHAEGALVTDKWGQH